MQNLGSSHLFGSNVTGSLVKLLELCKSVSNDYRNGKLKAEFTYEGFMERVRSIPANVDFSRIAKDRGLAKAAKPIHHGDAGKSLQ